jgi:hypothetical protein
MKSQSLDTVTSSLFPAAVFVRGLNKEELELYTEMKVRLRINENNTFLRFSLLYDLSHPRFCLSYLLFKKYTFF